ncbi:MAG TPA: hypothetical protein VES42_13070 [Pilimelia sp.]|nr:hypothetical protein [Pilimelia sp.]
MTMEATPASPAPYARWLTASAGAVALVVAANAVAGPDRWWANFVLLPGAAGLAGAVPLLAARSRGRVAAGYAALCVATMVVTVGVLLLFGAFGWGWPFMIMLPCAAVAGTARWRPRDANARAAHRTLIGLAALGVLLGGWFLLQGGDADYAGGVRWWGLFMLAAGAVAVGNGLSLLTDLRGYRLPTAVLLAGLGVGTILAALRELLWR